MYRVANNVEIIFWINRDGDIIVSDPSIELIPLFNSMGNEMEIRKRVSSTSRYIPRFIGSRETKLPVSMQTFSASTTEELWFLHDNAPLKKAKIEKDGNVSYLELKVELLKRLMSHCNLCERRCGINRFGGDRGFCHAGPEARITREFIHVGEEQDLIPSHTIFFAGCNMRCIFCHELIRNCQPSKWRMLTPLDLAYICAERHRQGAININLVGGEPTLYLSTIIEALTLKVMPAIPVVWNSNMYYSEEVSKILWGVMDIYLGDLKFGNNQCAEELSFTPDYWETVTRNLKVAKRQGAEVIVRHLPLPGHIECCTRPILQWIDRELKGVKVSILEYKPPDCTTADLNRTLTKRERKTLISILKVITSDLEVSNGRHRKRDIQLH